MIINTDGSTVEVDVLNGFEYSPSRAIDIDKQLSGYAIFDYGQDYDKYNCQFTIRGEREEINLLANRLASIENYLRLALREGEEIMGPAIQYYHDDYYDATLKGSSVVYSSDNNILSEITLSVEIYQFGSGDDIEYKTGYTDFMPNISYTQAPVNNIDHYVRDFSPLQRGTAFNTIITDSLSIETLQDATIEFTDGCLGNEIEQLQYFFSNGGRSFFTYDTFLNIFKTSTTSDVMLSGVIFRHISGRNWSGTLNIIRKTSY